MVEATPTTRRALLASAGAVGAASLAGCSERLWTRAEDAGPDQVELTIKTVPADDDATAATIMSTLRENLRDAGIAVSHEPVPKPDVYRHVLLQRDYDVFVLRHPGLDGYDALYGLLHSRFRNEPGWQNPFHVSDVDVDEYLDEQRRVTGDERRTALHDLLEHLARTVPYTTVAFHSRTGGRRDEISARQPPSRPLDYVDVLTRQPDEFSRDGPLEVGVFGGGVGERLNPVAIDHDAIDGLFGLLYDPLARRVNRPGIDAGENRRNQNADRTDESDGAPLDYVPWLAEEITWDRSPEQLRADVTLREGLEWHDGEPLDANDVVFTIRFLQDTSGDEIEDGLPAPRYRSRQTLVETVDAVDERTIRFSFGTAVRSVAARAFSLPVLPEHVWQARTDVVADHRTEALTTDNEEAIGSGLFELAEVTMDEIVLEPFSDHVFRDPDTDRPDVLEGFSQFSGIRFQIAPNSGSMIDSLLESEIDVTADDVPPGETDPILDTDGVSAITGPTDSFYMIGYNHHHPELGNPHFRKLLSRLVDREFVASDLLEGTAEPATSPRALLGLAEPSLEPELDLDIDTSVPEFPGENGEIDTELVRSLFQDAGYRYEDGSLLS